jgi:hypothetical protein
MCSIFNEISDVQNFGVIGRGSMMEIGVYATQFFSDELLGNIIDLCPVGALLLCLMRLMLALESYKNLKVLIFWMRWVHQYALMFQ